MTIYLHSEAAVMDQGEIQRLLQDRMFDSVLLFCEFELSSSSSPSSSELAAKKRSGSDGCCVPPAVPRRQALHYYGKALKGKTEHRRAVGYFNDALELLKLELHFASEEAERDGGPETDEEVCSLRELQLQMEMEMAVCLLAEQEEEKAFLILANIPSQRRNARANMMLAKLCERLDKKKQAITCFQEVLRLNPMALEAGLALVRLGVDARALTGVYLNHHRTYTVLHSHQPSSASHSSLPSSSPSPARTVLSNDGLPAQMLKRQSMGSKSTKFQTNDAGEESGDCDSMQLAQDAMRAHAVSTPSLSRSSSLPSTAWTSTAAPASTRRNKGSRSRSSSHGDHQHMGTNPAIQNITEDARIPSRTHTTVVSSPVATFANDWMCKLLQISGYMHAHKHRQALRALEELKELCTSSSSSSSSPGNVHLLELTALISAQCKSNEVSLGAFRALHSAAPFSIRHMDKYALHLRRKGAQCTKELADLTYGLLSTSESSPEGWIASALYADMLGDKEKALRLCEKAVSLDASHAGAQLVHGIILTSQSPQLAIRALRRSRQLHPGDLVCYQALVDCYLSTTPTMFKQALLMAKDALQLMPRNPKALTMVGMVLSHSPEGRLKASKAFNKALTVDADCVEAVMELANLKCQTKLYVEALELLEEFAVHHTYDYMHAKLAQIYTLYHQYLEEEGGEEERTKEKVRLNKLKGRDVSLFGGGSGSGSGSGGGSNDHRNDKHRGPVDGDGISASDYCLYYYRKALHHYQLALSITPDYQAALTGIERVSQGLAMENENEIAMEEEEEEEEEEEVIMRYRREELNADDEEKEFKYTHMHPDAETMAMSDAEYAAQLQQQQQQEQEELYVSQHTQHRAHRQVAAPRRGTRVRRRTSDDDDDGHGDTQMVVRRTHTHGQTRSIQASSSSSSLLLLSTPSSSTPTSSLPSLPQHMQLYTHGERQQGGYYTAETPAQSTGSPHAHMPHNSGVVMHTHADAADGGTGAVHLHQPSFFTP